MRSADPAAPRSRLGPAPGELSAATARIVPAAIDGARSPVARAGGIVLYGFRCGGLQPRSCAMRLHPLGLRVAMPGDRAAPPAGSGDLPIASDGPGEPAAVTAPRPVAREAGAAVPVLTAEPETPAPPGPAAKMPAIPAQTIARDRPGVGAESMAAHRSGVRRCGSS